MTASTIALLDDAFINITCPNAASGIADTLVVMSFCHSCDTSDMTDPNHSDSDGTTTTSTDATKCLKSSKSNPSSTVM